MAAAANSEGTVACGNCREPMQRLMLPGHYDRTVEVDLCSHLPPRVVRPDRDGAPVRPRAARPDRRDGADAAPAAPHARRESRLRALRRRAEDGATTARAGRLAAPRMPRRPWRLPDLRAVPAGEGPVAGHVAHRPRAPAADPGPHRLRQLRRGDRARRGDLPLLRLGAHLLDVARLARAPDPEGALGTAGRAPRCRHASRRCSARPAARALPPACRWTARNAARRWRSAAWPTRTSAWSRSAPPCARMPPNLRPRW